MGKFKPKLPNDRTIKNKQKMKKIFITTALIIVFNSLVQAQAERKDSLKADLNKNSLNLSLGPGGIIILLVPAHVSYERLFQGKVFGSRNSTIVDFGVGGASHWEGVSPFIISRFGILTGSGRRHFEAKVGACFFFAGDMQNMLLPSGSIGYRKQKPGGHFIFRTGIGFPDALYVSLGFSF